MIIFCPQCGAEIKAEDISLDNMMAKCASCNAVFSFADADKDRGQTARHQSRDTIPMPEGVTIQDDGFQLEIRRKWFSYITIFLGVFTLCWNGITFIVLPGLLEEAGAIAMLFLFPFLAVGMGVLYMTAAGFLNTTIIRVDTEKLSIQHGPVPYPGRVFASHDIEQIYTHQQIHRGSGSDTITYQLIAITFDGKQKKLFGNLYKPDHALYIGQEIERFLGIKDRPVRGEYR